MQETTLDREKAEVLFHESENNLSLALVMAKAATSKGKAAEALRSTNGKVEDAVKLLRS